MASLLTLLETEHTIFRNIGNYSPSDTMLHLRITESLSYILLEVLTVVRVGKSNILGCLTLKMDAVRFSEKSVTI